MSDLLNQASLVMIPSGYKEDTVYSVVPSDGSGDLSFTRASNGTRVNSAGLVEVCPWNLYSYSEIFSGGGWFNDGTSTATNNFTTAPNGTMTAAKVVANTANGYAYKSTIVAPNTYTLSYYVRASANTTMSIAINDPGGSGSSVKSNIAVTTQWQRIEHSALVTLGTSFYIDYAALQTGVDYFIWGAQVNLGSTAKPYFPTTDRLNVPRLTYQNGGGGCPSLLLEKQSTNLNLYSEDFSNAVYTLDGITVTANATTSPDGTQNADKLVANAVSGDKFAYQVITTSLGSVYTASAYFKASEYTYAFMRLGAIIGDPYIIYNLATQAVVSTSGLTSYSITSVGNGWYRITATATATTVVVAPNFMIIPSSGYTLGGDNIPEFTGNGSNGGFIWGAQLEASSYVTSYINTTSASATRVADACFKTGISSLIGQTEGVMFADFNFANKGDTSGSVVILLRGSSSEAYIYLTSSTVQADFISGAIQCSIVGSIGAVGRKKIAFAYKQNDFALYMNGVQIGTDSSGTVGSLTAITVGSYDSPGYLLNSGINQSALFKTRLTNAELASLTTL
jgi:hypothetical protein